MNFNDAINYIDSLDAFGIKLGLDNIKNLLELMDNPHRGLKIIHVAGTNGKGSTSNYIYETLCSAGYTSGLFTTPHLSYYNEKIRYNNKFISNDELVEVTEYVKFKVEEMKNKNMDHPTRFEVLTAIVFEFFKRKNIEFAIIEVGMGGRLDSTNIVESPIVSVITHIALDHKDYLGDTIEKVAFEKSGIIKKNSLVVTSNVEENILNVISDKANIENSELSVVDPRNYKMKVSSIDGILFEYKNEEYKIAMIAEYQVQNAILAIETLKKLRTNNFLKIEDVQIKEGISKSKWAGRFEKINDKPLVIIDGAHNVDGANALKKSIENLFENKKILSIFSMSSDKDTREIAKNIMGMFDKVFVTEANNPRAMKMKKLEKIIKEFNENTQSETLDYLTKNIEEISKEYDVTIIFGSLYMIGDFRKKFK